MRNIKYFLSAILVVGTLGACSSQWTQDPLADKDAALRDGQRKSTEPEKPKPIDSSNVVVETEETYTFREGTTGERVITARILENDYVPTMTIENLSDFPGATFTDVNYDAPTRLLTAKFTWTPALGTVSGNNGLIEDKYIKLLVVGNKPNANVIVGHKSIKTTVGKVLNVPEIFSVSKNSINIREGERTTITLKVRDKDSGVDAKTYPNIQVLPTTGYANLSQFVTITQVLATGNKEFAINLTIDLAGAELTKSRDRFGFTLKAVSSYNQMSAGQGVFINVLTSFADLENTWFDVIEVPLGVKKDFQFMIFDPKAELSVGAPVFTDLPYGATITCNNVGASRQICAFSWRPDFTVSEGDYSVQTLVVGKNQDSQDTFLKNVRFDLKLRVTSAPPVSPLAFQGGK